MFESIFTSETMEAGTFFIMILAALLAGAFFSFLSCLFERTSASFIIATALLPMTVAMVICLVNGNLGIGVAIAGAFGLVRFRSAPGSAREIAIIFIAMAAGLAFGMGYLGYGICFLLLSGCILLVYTWLVQRKKQESVEKQITITIPEMLDYTTVFDDVFSDYAVRCQLIKVKSINMGSMFRLTYLVKLKKAENEKKLLDAIRARNGNLEIVSSRADAMGGEL